MDDILLPDETVDDSSSDVDFQKSHISESKTDYSGSTGSINASDHVKITFDRFVTLVANHSFIDVVERNKDEEVIMSTNLLTDLANARGISPKTRGPLLLLAGVVIGIFIAYFLF